MKLKSTLIVVKDIEKAKQFYYDLFGLEMIQDNDGNMILTDGLVLQEERYWKEFLKRDIIPQNNSCELYFEEADIEGFQSCSVLRPQCFLQGLSCYRRASAKCRQSPN